MGTERAKCRRLGFIPILYSPSDAECRSSCYDRSASWLDGTTSWFKYSDAVEEWCDLTKVEAKRRGPAIATGLSGRAKLFKERLNRARLKDPETGVEYLLSTLRPYFVKDGQSVFLYSFFRCSVANMARLIFQHWMVRCEIARPKAVDAWLDITTLRPAAGPVQAEAK